MQVSEEIRRAGLLATTIPQKIRQQLLADYKEASRGQGGGRSPLLMVAREVYTNARVWCPVARQV